jgi:RHS repeat-associated protein
MTTNFWRLIFFLLVLLPAAMRAQQIVGQNPAMTTTTNVYTYLNSGIVFPSWQVNSNGQIVSSSQNGSTHQVSIKWNTPGSGVITFKDGSTTKATLTVTLTTTPLPPLVTAASRCGSGTLTLTATPQQGGNSIKWYTSPSGGVGTIGTSFTTPSISATTTYYATTYNSSTGAESTPRTSVNATVYTLPPAPSITNNKRMGSGVLTLSASGGANYHWYNPQNVLLATASVYTTPSISTSTSNYMYVKAISANGCVSTTQTWINITIDPKPQPTTTGNRIAMGSYVQLNAGTGYSSCEWKDASDSTIGNSPTILVRSAGKYRVVTTKTGYYGTGVSDFITIQGHLDDQNMNHIVANKLLIATKNAARVSLLPVDSVSQTVQYFDGLGRLLQTINTQASPLKQDIVFPLGYDVFGRETKKYLPYVNGSDGRYKIDALQNPSNNSTDEQLRYRSGKQYNFYQSGGLIAADQYPYAETVFEPSALTRPLQQGAPGAVWQPNTTGTYQAPASTGKAVLFSYELNASNEVLRWRHVTNANYPLGLIDAGTTTAPAYYAPNKLYKNRIKDENRNETITYTDTDGKIILKRVQVAPGNNLQINDVNFASTYYIYDDFGQLVCVLPPEATRNLATQYHNTEATDSTKNIFLDRWAFRYKYDDLFRMVRKKIPGAKPVYMVYDIRNRLVLAQDGNQRSNPAREWTFTKYDALNRPVSTGKYLSKDSLDVLQGKMDADLTSKSESYTGISGNYFGYTNQSFPSTPANTDYYTVTYYDKYDQLIAPSGYAYLYESLPGQENTTFENTTGQITGTLVRNLGTLSMSRTIMYYDINKRNIQTVSQNHRSGTIRTSMVYDFPGRLLLKQKTYKVNGVTITTKEGSAYDHAGRVMVLRYSVNGAPEVTIARNFYNELGQMIDKNLHSTDNGNSYRQSVDYRYSIRGWITKINQADISVVGAEDPLHDYFGMELYYNTGVNGLSSVNCYNGNISLMQWSRGCGSGISQIYSFAYDPMSRLLNATHTDYELDLATGLRSWKNNNNQFDEILSYDHNGNIKTLLRKGANGFVIDNLGYGYAGNQLVYVHDTGDVSVGFVNGNTGTDDYSYDLNGNLDKDRNKGLDVKGSIKYNFLNLPMEINKGSEKLKYIYDAAGRKLSQEVYNTSGTVVKVTDYIDDLVLEGTTTMNAVLKMILHPEGRILPDGANWEYQYHLKDHLGNVRLTFTTKAQAAATYSTDFETASNTNFLNYTRHTFDLVDHTDAGAVYQNTQRLTGNSRVGLAKTFSVMPGDKITASAYVKYMNLGTTANTALLINSLAPAFGVSSGSTGEAAKIYTALNGYAGLVAGGHLNDDDSGPPKAFITILFFDKNYKLLDAAWDQVSSNGAQTSPTTKQPHDLVTATASAPDAGYAYVFLSNEHPKVVEVYFDDVVMSYTPSAIVGVDDYYPFGLSYNKSERPGVFEQKYMVRENELQDELSLNWYDFANRFYDPTLGRWHCLDIVAESYFTFSPYAYVRNSPVLRIDPNGKWDVTVHLFNDREQYGYGVAIVTDRHGNEVFRFNVRAEGTAGRDRMVGDSDTPLGTYDIPDNNTWITGRSRQSYGPNARLNMVGLSGEIVDSGRDLIRIHGGQQEVYDSSTDTWIPIANAELKKTNGCLRAYDEDMVKFKEITDELEAKDAEEAPGQVTIVDDLQQDGIEPASSDNKVEVKVKYKVPTKDLNIWQNLVTSFLNNLTNKKGKE